MIEEPPPLVFAPAIERPPSELVEGLRGASTSFIVDAMGGSGALDWRIKPIVGNSLFGVALTCDCGPNDNLALIAACAESEPGDVLVAATGFFAGAAVTGDLLLGVARNRGVTGFVTDGLVRDLADLEALNLPVYAMGVSPNSPGKRGPARWPADHLRRLRGRGGRCGCRRSRRRCRRAARAPCRNARQSWPCEGCGSRDAEARAGRLQRPSGRHRGATTGKRQVTGAAARRSFATRVGGNGP